MQEAVFDTIQAQICDEIDNLDQKSITKKKREVGHLLN
jgi:hypothetical protein